MLCAAIEKGVRTFLADGGKADECMTAVREALGVSRGGGAVRSAAPVTAPAARFGTSAVAGPPVGSTAQAVHIDILQEYDIVTARGECKGICTKLGFTALDQVKIATVVSELARNIVQYAGTGAIDMTPVWSPKTGVEIIATDKGSGIPHISTVMSGSYDSNTGMGVGLIGTKRLMDEFDIETGPAGTRIRARKYLP
jgi:serine/threonine-protein kinase RsbT